MNLNQPKYHNKEKFPELPERKKFSRLRLVGILVLGSLVTVLLVTVFFVYDTVNNAVGQIETISGLQSDLIIEPIDFNKLENVKKRWVEKHDSSTNPSRDPFNPPTSLTTTSTVSGAAQSTTTPKH